MRHSHALQTASVLLVAAAIGLSTGRASTFQQGTEPTLADFDWFHQHRDEIVDKLMPLRREAGGFVTFRRYGEYHQGVDEQYFQVWFVGPMVVPPLTATVVKPVGASLQQQLWELHMKERGASAADLMLKIRYERRDITEADCPAIRKKLVALDTLKWPVPSRDLIALDATTYEIMVDYGGGFVDAVLVERQHPLVRWALETNVQLNACMQENRKGRGLGGLPSNLGLQPTAASEKLRAAAAEAGR
jgi:hypothetical protein